MPLSVTRQRAGRRSTTLTSTSALVGQGVPHDVGQGLAQDGQQVGAQLVGHRRVDRARACAASGVKPSTGTYSPDEGRGSRLRSDVRCRCCELEDGRSGCRGSSGRGRRRPCRSASATSGLAAELASALQLQAGGEQPLDHDVVQVAGDALAVGEDRELLAVLRRPGPGRAPGRPGRRTRPAARVPRTGRAQVGPVEERNQSTGARPGGHAGGSRWRARSPAARSIAASSSPRSRVASGLRRPAADERSLASRPPVDGRAPRRRRRLDDRGCAGTRHRAPGVGDLAQCAVQVDRAAGARRRARPMRRATVGGVR